MASFEGRPADAPACEVEVEAPASMRMAVEAPASMQMALREIVVSASARCIPRRFKGRFRVVHSVSCFHIFTCLVAGEWVNRRLAGLIGGKITLQSEWGRGSAFTLTLTASSAPVDESASKAHAEAFTR